MNLLVGSMGVSQLYSLGTNEKSKKLMRTFYSGRVYHQKKSKIDKLVKLIETQNTKIDSINSRLDALEGFSNVKNSMTPTVKTEDEYIRIGHRWFDKSKILKINFGCDGGFGDHYVVELEYERKRDTDFFFGTGKAITPIFLEYEEHKMFYGDVSSAMNVIDSVLRACPHLITSCDFLPIGDPD